MLTTGISMPFSRHRAIPLLFILSTTVPSVDAAELGARALRESWPTLSNNIASPYTKAGTGIVSGSSAESTFSSYASSSFHSLAVACSATGRNNGQFRRPVVGGQAYWFDQITITSPSVPNGTIGTADCTLFFRGKMSTGPSVSTLPTLYYAELEYSVSGGTADGVPDLRVGDIVTRRTEVTISKINFNGPEFFLNQPRNHRITFTYGVPFDFTIWLGARGTVWENTPSTMKASLQLTGWNGFNNIVIRSNGAAVTDAVIGSQTGFNYGGAGTSSFEQWASLYQVGANSATQDSNQNGIPNLLEYALGRNPTDLGGAKPVVLGKVMDEGVEYPTMVFTRPIAGARPGDIIYTPERSTTLDPDGWSTSGLVMDVEPDPNGLQQETVTVRSTEPIGSLDGEWMRLKVSTSPE